jgi:RimJ/RimL family protein N-acetyltransferase
VDATLRTDRLWLRPWTLDDAEAWHAIWGDPDVIWWGASESFEKSRAGLERLLGKTGTWPAGIGWLAVGEEGSEEVVGDVLLQPAPFIDGIEVGWHFRKHVWNRGYATEATRAVLERTFRREVVDRVWAIVATKNAPSLRVAEKLGMRRVKEMAWADMPHVLFDLRAPEGD